MEKRNEQKRQVEGKKDETPNWHGYATGHRWRMYKNDIAVNSKHFGGLVYRRSEQWR